jgi:hypothetical protein
MSKSMDAIRRAMADPISIVIVGVGGADFSSLEYHLSEISKQGREMVRFVRFQENAASSSFVLTAAALDPIPAQLEAYFAMRGIQPSPPVEVEEIVVEPYRSEPGVVGIAAPAMGVPIASPTPNPGPAVPVTTGTVVYNPSTPSPTAVPVAQAVPASSAPFSASLSSPYAAHSVDPGLSDSGGGHGTNHPPSGQNAASSSTVSDVKSIGTKLLNSRVGKQAVGRLKGQARAKINRFTRQTIGFGIL